jgi:ubiquinone/menaquinone biosynthesis C-methylase UbiE
VKSNLFVLITLVFACSQQKNQPTESIANQSVAYSEYKLDSLISVFDDPERDEWQRPDLVINWFDSLKGKVVADIGAGTGYFTFRLAQRAGQVIAIDIEQQFLDYIEEKKKSLPLIVARRIETRLTAGDHPGLNDQEADAVLIVNTYSYFKDRSEYLLKLKQCVKSNGILMVVDYKKGELTDGPAESLRISSEKVVEELTKAGFDVVRKDNNILEYQYIIKAINKSK